MKIDKAIELLKDIEPLRATLSEDDLQAIKIGIEALRRVEKVRHYKHDLSQVLLLGETEAGGS